MTHKTKKLIKAPEDIIPEFIDGFVGAYADLLTVEGLTGRAVVAKHGPRDGKVGIVVGGGSGHEPAFAGYVGRGLADAAAVGNVFASPSPEHILDAGRAADGGVGVLFLRKLHRQRPELHYGRRGVGSRGHADRALHRGQRYRLRAL